MGSTKTDNTSVLQKTAIREWLMDRFDHPAVLDLYCGKFGRMYHAVWNRAESYFGVDKFAPHSLANTARMSAERASQVLDLGQYNIFDLDCYDSPWAVARRILRRATPGMFGMALTCGEFRGLQNGNSNELVRATLGLSKFSDLRLLGRYHDLVIGLMLRSLTEMPGVKITEAIKAETDRHIVYLGMIAEKC